MRSNAIVIAKDGATLGIGAGQMSRVDSVRIAIEKARQARGEDADGLLAGSVVASDAFFPFPDGPQLAIDAGVDGAGPAGGIGARLGGDRRLRRGGRGDGVHRAPALPALARRRARARCPSFTCCASSAARTGAAAIRSACSSRAARSRPDDRQRIAADLGFSETVFVDDAERGEIRIFTPAVELPFAGHPVVGTAWLLARERGAVAALRPPAGEVPVREEGGLTFAAGRPEWMPEFEFVEVGSAAEVEALGGPPGGPRCGRGVGVGRRGRGRRSASGCSRPRYGIDEDEATGSAAITLSARLGRELEIRQGAGSRILARPLDDGMVEIGGRVELDEVRRHP